MDDKHLDMHKLPVIRFCGSSKMRFCVPEYLRTGDAASHQLRMLCDHSQARSRVREQYTPLRNAGT